LPSQPNKVRPKTLKETRPENIKRNTGVPFKKHTELIPTKKNKESKNKKK